MTIQVLDALILGPDTSEVVGLQIAAILAAETVNQKALAVAAGKDPALWDLRIFVDRFNPWEDYLEEGHGSVPIVNVWTERGDYPRGEGGLTQQAGVFNFRIDVAAVGAGRDEGTGQIPADLDAAQAAKRAYRLVRNILMAGINVRLQKVGKVTSRWIQGVQFFQPQRGQEVLDFVTVAQMLFEVKLVEEALEYQGQEIEGIDAKITRTADGQVLAEATY